MAATNHDAFVDAAALYAVGALPPEERAAFEAHARECAACTAEVGSLSSVARTLPLALPQIDPPFALRARVLAAARGTRAAHGQSMEQGAAEPPRWRRTIGWLSAAALLALAAAVSADAVATRQRLRNVEVRLQDALDRLGRSEARAAAASQESAGIQARLAVLIASDLTQVNLAGQPSAPAATGRAFLSRSRGLVFAASNLPALPAGRTYQLWYLTGGAPLSAGLFKPDASGRAVVTLDPPPSATTPSGLAVSIEPDGGVPAPTGAIYLAGQTH